MSEEKKLEQLLADLKVLKKYRDRYGNFGCAVDEVAAMIREKEAEADQWREAQKALDHWRSNEMMEHITGFFDHLTAEKARLEKRVAELEAEKDVAEEIESDYYNVNQAARDAYEAAHKTLADTQPPSETAYVESELAKFVESDADEPGPLDRGRVLATAETMGWGRVLAVSGAIKPPNARPYRLKGAGE